MNLAKTRSFRVDGKMAKTSEFISAANSEALLTALSKPDHSGRAPTAFLRSIMKSIRIR